MTPARPPAEEGQLISIDQPSDLKSEDQDEREKKDLILMGLIEGEGGVRDMIQTQNQVLAAASSEIELS